MLDNIPPAPEMFLLNFSGPSSLDIFEGHSKATMLLIVNNAAQGILSSFFFKYAGEIIYSICSTLSFWLIISSINGIIISLYLALSHLLLLTRKFSFMVFYSITQFVHTRYDSEEVFVDRCNDIYRHSICFVVWSYTDHKLSSWDFCCFHLNAPGIKIERVVPLIFPIFSLD